LVKYATKKFLFGRNWKTCETLKSVRWNRVGLRWKVILDSFLYIYNKCAFSILKSHFNFFTYTRKTIAIWTLEVIILTLSTEGS
jgi:hypothetical protein